MKCVTSLIRSSLANQDHLTEQASAGLSRCLQVVDYNDATALRPSARVHKTVFMKTGWIVEP